MIEQDIDKTKLFTDPMGKFQMYIPLDWQYKNPSTYKNEKAPHSFERYDRSLGIFQVSCVPIDEDNAVTVKNNKLEIQSSDFQPDFEERFAEHGDLCAYMWLCAMDDHLILITYTFGSKLAEKPKTIKEFLRIRSVLNGFQFIKPEYREKILATRRYNLFMGSIATALELRTRAQQHGAFIEVVVLSANRIDALLRLAIILKTQLENRSEEIDTRVLYQGSGDRPVSERQIYKQSLEKNIIEQSLYELLERLYKDRNKVVHQFIITDILTEDLLEISNEYYQIDKVVANLIDELEYEQYKERTGMFTSAEAPPAEYFTKADIKKLLLQVRDKHGYVNWHT